MRNNKVECLSFEKNDKLGREKFGKFLTNIIEQYFNGEDVKRASDSSSFVLAIDSPWGTGKTTLLNMWKNSLLDIHDGEEKDKYCIINYDAWQNDFSDNPFETLIAEIITADVFENLDTTSKRKAILAELGKAALKVAREYVKKKIADEVGDEIIESYCKAIKDGDGKLVDAICSDNTLNNTIINYKKNKKNIDELKEQLTSLARERPMIIMIDELDRCKPSFAIRLLEVIKHILDVPNLVFVFALDMEQLSHSVKVIYGQGMDASGYLCRFFDYISRIPTFDRATYITNLVEENNIKNKDLYKLEKSTYTFCKNKNDKFFSEMFIEYAEKFALSLRDILTIYKSFKIFESIELANSANIDEYELYMFLMILKYKDVNKYQNLFISNIIPDGVSSELKEKLKKVVSKDKIETKSYDIYEENFQVISAIKIEKIDKNNIKYFTKEDVYNIKRKDLITNISNCISLSGVLFYNDLLKWNEIKTKTLGTYIQEKLEMYNFYEGGQITEPNV